MKLYITIFLLIFTSTLAQSEDIITIKDTSGASKEEIRNLATIKDKEIKKDAVWEELAPTPKKYDWIKLKSGEWLKGKLKAMYSKKLEFDSDKLNLLSFEFKDIYQIRSYHIMTISIQVQDSSKTDFFDVKYTTVQTTGIIRMDRKDIKIIQGDTELVFPREQIVSIAYEGTDPLQHWSGKITLNLNTKSGNSKQLDYTANARIQRRTAFSRLSFDYIGNITDVNEKETTNNHRLNQSLNLYVTKKFFLTPVYSEYFHDIYQNIESQWTIGAGAGYTLVDTKYTDWSFSMGPAAIRTFYDTVEDGSKLSKTSWAIQLSSLTEIELTDDIDLTLNYTFTKLSKDMGNYKHHTVTKIENEITSWLDFDITFIWDYLHEPTAKEDGTLPYKNDVQLLFGIGVDF